MSYLRHLHLCNRFDPERFLPLLLAGHRVGFVRRDNARQLQAFPDIFRVSHEAVTLAETIDGPQAATEAFAEATDALIRAGAIKLRRHERFAITDGWGGPLLFELERGAIEFFGAPAYAVQLNGWRPGDDGLDFWIAKRAQTKPTFPGKLDNIVAGGIGAGYTAWETLLKEAGEEAGMPRDLAARARPTGALRFRREMAEGMRDEVLFIYDIQTPADFTPRNTDGEVEDFRLLSARESLRLVRDTDDFMYDVNLVLVDFAIRHGLITPEAPDYLALVDGLRGGLVRGAR